jgi:hypothetical protein
MMTANSTVSADRSAGSLRRGQSIGRRASGVPSQGWAQGQGGCPGEVHCALPNAPRVRPYAIHHSSLVVPMSPPTEPCCCNRYWLAAPPQRDPLARRNTPW